jgi:hypothetical protein
MIIMKNMKPDAASAEIKCAACNGTGFPAVAQPLQAGRKILCLSQIKSGQICDAVRRGLGGKEYALPS